MSPYVYISATKVINIPSDWFWAKFNNLFFCETLFEPIEPSFLGEKYLWVLGFYWTQIEHYIDIIFRLRGRHHKQYTACFVNQIKSFVQQNMWIVEAPAYR